MASALETSSSSDCRSPSNLLELATAEKAFAIGGLLDSESLQHTAPQRCQPDRLVTPDFLLHSSYCDQDMTISVAR